MNPSIWGGASVKGARFLLPEMLWNDVDDDISAVMNTAIGRLESAGAQIIRDEVSQLDEVTKIFLTFGDLFSATAYAELREKVDAQPHLVLRPDPPASSAVCRRICRRRASCLDGNRPLRSGILRTCCPFTAVLCPTTTISPPPIADVETDAESLCNGAAAYPDQHPDRQFTAAVWCHGAGGICQRAAHWPDGLRITRSGPLHSPHRQGRRTSVE